ncbi:methyl-accepting chemotaxis protein [Methylomonas sp. 2B]
MTVKQRLLLLSSSAMLGLVGLALLGYIQLAKVYDAASYAGVNTVPTYRIFFEIRKQLADLREYSLFHVIITDPAGMATLEPKIAEARAKLDDAFKRYTLDACNGASCLSDAKEQAMLDNVKSLLAAYDIPRLKVFDFSRQNRTKEAETIVREELMPAVRKLQDAIQTEMDYNSQLADQGMLEASRIQQSATNTSVGIAVLITLLVGMMSWMIIRNLMRQLGGEPDAVAGLANQIAVGDLSGTIVLQAGDNASVMAAMKHMSDTIKTLLAAMGQMAQSHEAGDIDAVVDAAKFQGSFQSMAQGVNDMVGAQVAVTQKAMGVFKNFGQGDFEANIEKQPGKRAFINEAIELVRGNLKSFIADMNRMAGQHDAGEIDFKIDTGKFQGEFATMAKGVNDMVGAHIAVNQKAIACFEQFGQGNLDADIEKLPGKLIFINNAIDKIRANLRAVIADTDTLIKAAAEGRLDVRADAAKHQGDFRRLVQGINDIIDGIVLPVNEAIEVLTLVEQGDLTRAVKGNYRGQLGEFKDTVNNTLAKLSQTIAEVVSAANQLGNASEQIQSTSQALSQAASEQAAGVEETSASIEEMAASIGQNAENAKVTDGMATKASQEAVEGGAAVKQTVEAMKSIAGKIGIIDDIAYQTNMLALNAAIEAARAGDHGKGFAVVAAEVRKLAERSQIAAQEIGQLAETSVSTAESAGRLLDAIVPSIAKTSDLVQEIAAASQEQSAGVSQVNTAMNQMNQITQQNAAASEELASTAEEMTGQAEQLQGLMSFFKISGATGNTGGGQRRTAHSTTQAKIKHAPTNPNDPTHLDLNLHQFERF